MDITVLSPTFERLGNVDYYISLLWVQRYSKCGDFELVVPASIETASLLTQDNYLWIRDFPDVYMVIEDFDLNTHSENGDTIIASGRTLSSILDRRCIFPQTTVSGNVQNAIKKLVEQNAGVLASAERKIENLVVQNNADTSITSLTGLRAQFTGDNLLDSVISICEIYDLGFKIIIRNGQFIFSLYRGIDRSSSQSIYPRVIFSSEYNNLLDSSYSSAQRDLKNVAIVQGEGEGESRKTETLDPLSAVGLSRRELYVDARDISSRSYDEEESEISPEEYSELLLERGAEKLLEHIPMNQLEANPVPDNQYTVGIDYQIGDVVQLKNSYGISARARVTEIIFSDDENGSSYVPTFELIA